MRMMMINMVTEKIRTKMVTVMMMRKMIKMKCA